MAARRSAPRAEPARLRLDVDERRRRLVALGLDLFSSRAYDDVSIDELAEAAGISKGLLYHYFPTKKDFYVAIVRAAAEQLLERTGRATAGEPMARLRAGLDEYLHHVGAHRRAYTALLRSGVGSDDEVAGVVDETRAALCARLVEGIPTRGALVPVALRGWIGFVEATTLEWLDGRREAAPDVLRELFVDVLVCAIESAARRS